MQLEEKQINIIHTLVEQEGIDKIDLSEVGFIDPDILNRIPEDVAFKHRVIPFSSTSDSICIATANPFDIYAQEAVRLTTNSKPVLFYTPEAQIEEYLRKFYLQEYTDDEFEDFSDGFEIDVEIEEEEKEEELNIEILKNQAKHAPAIRFVNNILLKAIQERASDIHFEPQENNLKVRFRIDGVLREVTATPKKLMPGIISRIKIISSLDIAERRLPQDGRCKIKIFGRGVDIRISTLPTVFGEKVVLRILDKEGHSLNINDIGLEEDLKDKFTQALNEPHGIILVTGPTGSGKTTTLYSALNQINSEGKNIVTIEDPVEYQLKGINQMQTKTEIGLTFAAGLRTILRQDPDIIMIGEIRDLEAAEIAMRAAMTGHLVFSTLHTNNSIATILRLIDMGVDKFLICSSILAVMAQRLVRRICFHCTEEYTPEDINLDRVKKEQHLFENVTFLRGKGCTHCGETGYWGRLAIFEILPLNNTIRNVILKDGSYDEIKEVGLEYGMELLLNNGLKKVSDGLTTIEEVMRVTSAVF